MRSGPNPSRGARGGALLDQLVVRIDCDISGLTRGIAQAIAEIRTLKGALTAQVGGVSLGDAMTAALVAPLAVATARIGQMRNEVRLLTSELRNVAAIGYGGPAPAGRSMGAIVPVPAGGPVVDASANGQPRGAGGRYVRGPSYRVEGDDLAGAARMGGAGPTGPSGGVGPRPPGPFAGVFGWGGRIFDRERARTSGAFNTGRESFPGWDDAQDNLGGSARSVGAAGRRAAGSRIAAMLGLVGLGALFGDLVRLAASLATVLGGTLAGAFSALLTPLGAVVALITTLVGLFVAANWDQFREFFEWFGRRWTAIISAEGMGDIIAGWNNFKDAIGELWATIRVAFKDDSNSIFNVLTFFGEAVIRIINAVMELLGGLLNVIAELVRAVAALIRGDWQGAWEHFGEAVRQAFRAVLNTIGSLVPEIQTAVDDIASWVEQRFRDMGEVISDFFASIPRMVPTMRPGAPLAGRGGGKAANDNGKPRGGGKYLGLGAMLGFSGIENAMPGDITPQMERMTRLAHDFAGAITNAFDRAIVGGGKFSDVVRQLIYELGIMTIRTTFLQPLANGLSGALSGAMGGTPNPNKGKGGGIMSAVGSFFAGFFADGGFIPPGGWGVVGERGPEIAFGGRSGKTIIPANDGGLRIDARAFIDARGADPAAISRLEAALARRDAELPGRIRTQVGDMRQRGRL